jgi:hypothetical protein
MNRGASRVSIKRTKLFANLPSKLPLIFAAYDGGRCGGGGQILGHDEACPSKINPPPYLLSSRAQARDLTNEH